MDSASGSEFQPRGGEVEKGAVETQPGFWFAAANLDAPDSVGAVRSAVEP